VPTYQYTCTDCGEQVEVVQKFSDDPLKVCPVCGGALRKVFSPVGIVFKGSGFYRTDSRNGSSAERAKKDKEPSGSGAKSSGESGGSASKDGGSSGSGSSDSGSSGSGSSASGSGSSGSGSSASGSGSSGSGSSGSSGDKKGSSSSSTSATSSKAS
jgi:putative FmdB family regulatory protein